MFTVYTSSLVNVLVAHGVDYHFYADDSQLYIQIDNIPDAKERLTLLMSDIKIWMARRKFKSNEGKTEIIIVRGNHRNDLRADFGMLHFENTQLVPCECAKNLGVVLDSTLSFRPHIDCQKIMIIVFKTIQFYCIRYNLVSHAIFASIFFYQLQVENGISQTIVEYSRPFVNHRGSRRLL